MTTILRFISIILAALLAGTSFGIWMGFNPENLSAATYVEQQQHLLRSLNTLMISLVMVATLITLMTAFLQRRDKQVFILLLVAAAFFIACIIITRFGNKPLQDRMLSWNIDSLPSNWTMLRDNWWSFHIMRTITELIALGLITWVNIKKGNPTPAKTSLNRQSVLPSA
jgi:uncharacterized membrane protein